MAMCGMYVLCILVTVGFDTLFISSQMKLGYEKQWILATVVENILATGMKSFKKSEACLPLQNLRNIFSKPGMKPVITEAYSFSKNNIVALIFRQLFKTFRSFTLSISNSWTWRWHLVRSDKLLQHFEMKIIFFKRWDGHIETINSLLKLMCTMNFWNKKRNFHY